MLRAILWHTIGWIYLVLTSPLLLRVKYLDNIGKSSKRDELVDKFSRRSTRFLFKLTGSTLDIKGLEKIPADGPVLYVCNHQSHMDSAVMHGFFPKRKGFISIVEVLKFPILRTWMKHMECVFMDRGNIRQSLTCINKAVDILKSGRSMVLFPEGRLGDGVAVGEFKKGSVKLAAKAGVPIIPVTIRNSINVMNKNATNVKAVHVECIVAAPINPEEFGIDDDKHVMEKLREIIISNL